ncbi:TetR family transcriptional regulator [Murinocardiopsis flavida]|uniref:TetR family transcriptional regulator n=1 Tax=Murinocardiopsis flavida TaxID=645275 RepID=A0A2P8DGE5_9ACTN|nr:TetR/AcrR family transcriptional regulator [Murinocardiopsis flavida]PSK96290.1 TetR family transcriptional regulator [Murinocardiopsis flavida]
MGSSNSGEYGITRVMEQLWGLTEAPRKGPRPTVHLAQIIDAAIGIADADGYSAVSMSRVAKQIGVTTMALYRHVESKDDLLALMVDAVTGRMPQPADLGGGAPGPGWRDGLDTWCREYLALLLRHPWTLHINAKGPPLAPNHLRWLDAGLKVLEPTRLSETEKLGVILTLHNYVQGTAKLHVDFSGYGDGDPAEVSDINRDYEGFLQRLITADRFPSLSTAVQAGAFSVADSTAEEDAEYDLSFSLGLLLDGVQRLVEARAREADAG